MEAGTRVFSDATQSSPSGCKKLGKHGSRKGAVRRARYLDPKTSRWLSTDPALGEYIPKAPIDEEAKRYNQNLPGMGGIYNTVNFHLYHYAGNNPVKYTDPTGRNDEEPSTFKVPKGFWNQFTANTMKGFWPTSKNETKCSTFLPFLTKKLGTKVYKDIFPNGEQQADKLDDSFKDNPNLQQVVGTGETDFDKAASAANQAQELANAGYLVLTALDTTSDGHVSAVGPQSLTYGTYPSQAWEGHTPPGPAQSGNGYGTVLRNYPVFVQAGSYTGVVTPRYAQGRSNLNANKVLYFLYKPVDR